MNCRRQTITLTVVSSALFLAGLLMPRNAMAVDVPVTSGLSVWLRADRGVLTNATGYVTNWQDQATSDGSQNATQTTAANQPLFVASAAGLNNQPVVRFDGVSDANWDKLNLGNVGGAFTAATLFVVETVTLSKSYSIYSSSLYNDTYWYNGSGGYVGPFCSGRYNQGGTFGRYPTAPLSGSHITEFRAGADYTEFTDGTSLGTLTAANSGYVFAGGTTHNIGGETVNNTFGGDVAEVLVYNRVLTDTERNQVGGYLENRYRISGSCYLPPVAPPSGLTATVANSFKINLGWIDNSFNETGFKIERATDSGFTANLTLVTTTATNVTNYSDTGLSPTTTYYYRVRATNIAGDSDNSATASATTLRPVVSESLSISYVGSGYSPASGVWTNNVRPGTSDATAFTDATHVKPTAATINGYPAVQFTGSNYLNATFTSGNFTAATVFVVADIRASTYELVHSSGRADTYTSFGGSGYPGLFRSDRVGGTYSGVPQAGAGVHIFGTRSSAARFSVYIDASNQYTTGTTTFQSTGQLRIGNNTFPTGPFSGDIAEILIYNRVLNAAESVIVENSLSAKYGTVLATNDVYTGDNGAKGDYDLDVIGIGSKTSDALAPGKVSASENVAGLQLVELNGSLADGEFLLAGHKVAANSWTTSDMPSGRQRSSRVWYVEKTGTVDATFTIDCAAAGLGVPTKRRYSLMYSSSPVFSFSKVSVGSPAGAQVSFSLTDTQLVSGYYTIGEAPLVGSTFIAQ